MHPPGTVFQRPFSTGELEIAGFEDNTSDGRGSAQSAGRRPGAPVRLAPALGRRIYQKGLQTFVWKADDENDDRLQYDVFYRREGETAWKALQRGADGSDLRLGHDVGARRHLLRQGRGVRRAVELAGHGARRRARERQLRHRQHAAEHRGAAGGARRRRTTTVKFVVRDDQSPVQRVEYSLDASRWRVVYPKDGIPDSRREEFEVALDESRRRRAA